jgi:hypothetical protein
MIAVSALEAKTRFGKLLDRVALASSRTWHPSTA